MTSSIFWSYGFFYWMATILVSQCRADCGEISVGCNCSISDQTGLVSLSNCQTGIVNLANLYRLSKTSKSLIEIRDSSKIVFKNNDKYHLEDEMRIVRMREVSLFIENVTSVTIKSKTFDQLIITAVLRNITNLNLEEKCFSSCWGTVLLFDSPIKNTTGPFSSSDMVVYKSDTITSSFSIHTRPEVTPRQKLYQVYKISNKLDDLEITIYAVLALIGAVILTLISLTIVVARKFAPPSSRLENLPDVVRTTAPVPQRRNNPVTKVSRISRIVFQKRVNTKDPHRPKANNHHKGRPPLPPPTSNGRNVSSLQTLSEINEPHPVWEIPEALHRTR